MESALIISHSEKGIDVIEKILKLMSCKKIATVKSASEARRAVSVKEFDLFIINSPINSDVGEGLAKELVSLDVSQVIIIVKNDSYDYVSSLVEDFGVITLSKPINKSQLWVALKLAKASHQRLKKMKKMNVKLTQKIDDIKIVDRAKRVLITHLNMSEEKAHKFIEKKAMDTRMSRREIAENILKTYES